jgi:tRNA(Ile)-lysidine synthase
VTTASGLHTRISDLARSQHLFRPGDTLIIGLSGGADSMAMLDLMATLPAFQLSLVAAHLNHCLRGDDSNLDEQFCRDAAARYGIPFESRRVDVRAAAAAGSLNLEDAGRRARIAFFDELCRTWHATAVVLAHHADDQAETVLMRLLRGSGMTGLAGMPWRNGRGYIRPLLNTTRAELEAYLADRRLNWREDASNCDPAFLRNRVRHELLPLMERCNPAVRTSLATTARILSEEDALLDALTEQAAKQVCRFPGDCATCGITLLRTHPAALQRRLIRLMLSRLAGNLEHFTSRHLEDILHMTAAARPNLRICLPRGLTAFREYDTLVIRGQETKQPEAAEVIIPGPGSYRMPDGSRLCIEFAAQPAEPFNSPATAYFDGNRMPFPWHVRTFRPGDRIQPLGMSGRKKVKDLFIDEKIPAVRRALIPLVFCGGELIWVAGLRTSHPSRVDALTTLIVKAVFSLSGAACAVN